MIRVICRDVNIGAAANVGGPVDIEHRTFDVELTAIETWLKEPSVMNDHYRTREVIGFELLPDTAKATP